MEYKIESTHINLIIYYVNTLTLRVNFTTGSVYDYYPFYENQLQEFIASKSKGTWFNVNIKKNKSIRFKKIK